MRVRMKKIMAMFLIVVLFTLFVSCAEEQSFDNWKPNFIAHYKGCEYYLDGYRLTHSGTCINPIHPENWTKEIWQEKLGLANK